MQHRLAVRLAVWGGLFLVPPTLFFLYQLVRELSGRLPAPILLVGESAAGALLLAVAAAGLPLAASILGLLAAGNQRSRWLGLGVALAGVLIILANVATRDS